MLVRLHLLILPLLLAACSPSPAATPHRAALLAATASATVGTAECPDRETRRDGVRLCETRTLDLRGRQLTLDASPNGGISVTGWSRSEIQVVAHVEAWGDREDTARRLLRETEVHVRGRTVSTHLPKREGRQDQREGWSSVRYEVRVPREAELDLRTVNGGIVIADVAGTLSLRSTNGGIELENVGGEIDGRTTNGPVHVRLNQSPLGRLALETTNGPVTLVVPANLSAEVDARTSLGPVRIDGLPLEESGCNERGRARVPCLNGRVVGTLGQGGAALRLRTTNGPISLRGR